MIDSAYSHRIHHEFTMGPKCECTRRCVLYFTGSVFWLLGIMPLRECVYLRLTGDGLFTAVIKHIADVGVAIWYVISRS